MWFARARALRAKREWRCGMRAHMLAYAASRADRAIPRRTAAVHERACATRPDPHPHTSRPACNAPPSAGLWQAARGGVGTRRRPHLVMRQCVRASADARGGDNSCGTMRLKPYPSATICRTLSVCYFRKHALPNSIHVVLIPSTSLSIFGHHSAPSTTITKFQNKRNLKLNIPQLQQERMVEVDIESCRDRLGVLHNEFLCAKAASSSLQFISHSTADFATARLDVSDDWRSKNMLAAIFTYISSREERIN